MSSLCRHKLLKSIQMVHNAVISYANCVCEDFPKKEKEIFLSLDWNWLCSYKNYGNFIFRYINLTH